MIHNPTNSRPPESVARDMSPVPRRPQTFRSRTSAVAQRAPFAALSTALTEAVATSESVPKPNTVRPSGVRHCT